MRRHSIIGLLTSVTCLTAIDSSAQQDQKLHGLDQYKAVQWTMENGLSFNSTNVMIKDVYGFLWFGSYLGGLCRFDGARFIQYLPEKNKLGAIHSDQVVSFTEDSLHNIWLGTDQGLARYDIKADRFTNFTSLHGSVYPNSIFRPLFATIGEIYCIEPGPSITAFNVQTLARTGRRSPYQARW